MKQKIKALVLLSGGLDSILAAKILQEQGIEVVGVSFKSYFFGAGQAQKAAQKLKIPLKTIDFSKEHLAMVKKPKHGYGKAMNPCIDCHTLMLKKAKEIMEKEKFDPAKSPKGDRGASFVATGEVLGERPMSQNKQALKLIEKESGLQGYLLRPLSAKLLESTIPEKNGWVDREKLFAISGRSRKKQMTLAHKWNIREYPTPAGGCLLTDVEFSKKLRELFEKYPRAKGNDIELLKVGRHFYWDYRNISKGKTSYVKIIVGRNHEENLKIKELAKTKDVLIELKDVAGPTTLIRSYGPCKVPAEPRGKKEKISEKVLKKAKELTKYYSTKARNKKSVNFKIYAKPQGDCHLFAQE